MKKLLTIIIPVSIIAACNQTKTKGDAKVLDFGVFKIETPHNWTKINAQGLDSHVGRIAIDSSDTLEFDLGRYSNDLKEFIVVKLPDSTLVYYPTDIYSLSEKGEQRQTMDSIGSVDTLIFINEKPEGYTDISKVEKSRVGYQTLDGKLAKILTPIIPGTGITGVYIDSLWKRETGIDRFNLYGFNLKPQNQEQVLKSIQTLKFYKRN